MKKFLVEVVGHDMETLEVQSVIASTSQDAIEQVFNCAVKTHGDAFYKCLISDVQNLPGDVIRNKVTMQATLELYDGTFCVDTIVFEKIPYAKIETYQRLFLEECRVYARKITNYVLKVV